MNQDIVNLLLGFLLTTVLGGALASYLQQRSWKHQNEAHLKEEELRRAGEICELVSQLLDKRLYRMRRLYYACQGYTAGTISREVLELRLQDYDKILYDWNDRLNLNLALIGTYFGKSARAYLDRDIYETFKDVGRKLEEAYIAVSRKTEPDYPFPELLCRLDQLSYQVYNLGIFMMTLLREGQVGRSAPEPLIVPPLRAEAGKETKYNAFEKS